jgi:hypothetical protein
LRADDDFKPLFPNDSLEGWRVSAGADLAKTYEGKEKAWSLEKGLLTGNGLRTFLRSPDEYGDFVLKFDWQISKGANAGVGLRLPAKGDPSYAGLEIEMVHGEVFYRGHARVEQLTGAIFDEVPAGKDAQRPIGQWNSYEITCKGSRIAVVLNGEKVIDEDLSRHTVARQKKGPPLADRPRRGYIGFQNLSGGVAIRKAQIKMLPPAD